MSDLAEQYRTAIINGDTTTMNSVGRQLDQLDAADRGRRDRPDAILAAALWYATIGVPVFPLQPRGKTPATKNGFKNATTDEAQIRAWWVDNPTYNLAVPTGVLFDVIDLDGPDAIAGMYFGTEPLIDTVTIIGKATTSRDGGQHLYVPPTGAGNKAAIYPGIDYRGAGGYVVAPPSVGANGRRYMWTQPISLPQQAAA